MNTITTTNAQTGHAITSEILERCWKVSIDVNCPSFRLTLDRSQITEVKTNSFVDPLKDTYFVRYRQESRVFMLQHGVKFDGGYLVPDERVDEVMEGLAAIAAKYVANIDQAMIDWPESVEALMSRLMIKGEVEKAKLVEDAYVRNGGAEGPRRSLGFRYSKYKISYAEDSAYSLIEHEASGLVGQIALDVQRILAEKKDGIAKEGLRMSTWLKMFKQIHRKVEGLAFISPEVAGLSEVLGDVIIPKLQFSTKIDAADEILISGVIAQLNNISAIVSGSAIAGIRVLAEDGIASKADDGAWAKAQVTNAATDDDDEMDGLFDDEDAPDSAEAAEADADADSAEFADADTDVAANAYDDYAAAPVVSQQQVNRASFSAAQPLETSDW